MLPRARFTVRVAPTASCSLPRGRDATASTEMHFESSIGIQEVTKRIDMMNAREFAQIVNERARNDNIPAPFPSLDNLPADTRWQDVIFRAAPVR